MVIKPFWRSQSLAQEQTDKQKHYLHQVHISPANAIVSLSCVCVKNYYNGRLMVQPPRVNSDNGLPQRWLTTVTSSYDKNLHPQISQRVGFSPQITGYFQYFMHNIATIYQHQLNKFESLTLVSMRAVYPENFHQIGSVQKNGRRFSFFMRNTIIQPQLINITSISSSPLPQFQ